jgi:hypothetical protein
LVSDVLASRIVRVQEGLDALAPRGRRIGAALAARWTGRTRLRHLGRSVISASRDWPLRHSYSSSIQRTVDPRLNDGEDAGDYRAVAGERVGDGAVWRPQRDVGTCVRDDAEWFAPANEAAMPSPPYGSPVSDRDSPVFDDVPVTDGGRPAETERDGGVEPTDPPPDALVRVRDVTLEVLSHGTNW